MGARPIAVLDAIRFGPLDDPEYGDRNRRILEGVVDGISHYGNCFGVPTIGGEMRFRALLQRQSAGERLRAGRFSSRRNFLRPRDRHRQSGDLRRRQDRPRRDSRRVHGLGRIHRGIEAEAPQRAGGRSVHGKAAARSLHRGDAHGRGGRHSGYGRGRPDLLHLRNGQPRGNRRRDRSGAACRSAKPA